MCRFTLTAAKSVISPLRSLSPWTGGTKSSARSAAARCAAPMRERAPSALTFRRTSALMNRPAQPRAAGAAASAAAER